jgi:TolA-binding protein
MKEREILAREQTLLQNEERLATLLNQKDQEIASLQQLVSQLQQQHHQQLSRRDVELIRLGEVEGVKKVQKQSATTTENSRFSSSTNSRKQQDTAAAPPTMRIRRPSICSSRSQPGMLSTSASGPVGNGNAASTSKIHNPVKPLPHPYLRRVPRRPVNGTAEIPAIAPRFGPRRDDIV